MYSMLRVLRYYLKDVLLPSTTNEQYDEAQLMEGLRQYKANSNESTLLSSSASKYIQQKVHEIINSWNAEFYSSNTAVDQKEVNTTNPGQSTTNPCKSVIVKNPIVERICASEERDEQLKVVKELISEKIKVGRGLWKLVIHNKSRNDTLGLFKHGTF